MAANKGALSNTQVTTWSEDLDNTVVDGLQLLDDVADTLLDIATTGVALTEAYFTYQYNSVASMGILRERPVSPGDPLTKDSFT